MTKTKIAVIGCGNIARNAHIPSYMNNPDAEIKYFIAYNLGIDEV